MRTIRLRSWPADLGERPPRQDGDTREGIRQLTRAGLTCAWFFFKCMVAAAIWHWLWPIIGPLAPL